MLSEDIADYMSKYLSYSLETTPRESQKIDLIGDRSFCLEDRYAGARSRLCCLGVSWGFCGVNGSNIDLWSRKTPEKSQEIDLIGDGTWYP